MTTSWARCRWLGVTGALVLPLAAQLPRIPLATGQATERPREVLFLGRQVTVHHSPPAFHSMMRLPWAERDLRMKFTVDLADLNPANLAAYDALFIYGNAFYGITPEQETAMEQYANGGGGVAAMHVACWSFPDAAKVTSIIGGAFLGHYAIQEFSQVILDVDHPILKGLGTYTSVDEPYQFKNVMADRTILTVRPGPGPETEMTWVRSQGQGRVFYHSGGHDGQTWVQPNFRELVTRGIEWVAKPGDGPAVVGIDRARIGNGGAIAVRASLDGPGEETLDAVLTLQGGKWHRPVLKGETLYDQGSAVHAPAASDVLRVGGQVQVPVLAMSSKFTDAEAVLHWGLWAGRGGLARLVGQEDGYLWWGDGLLEMEEPPVGSLPELVMNASGTSVAQVFVTQEGFPELDTALVRTLSGSSGSDVLLLEGKDPGLPSGPWICGDLSSARLSLNGPGHLAVILPGSTGKRLLLDTGTGWNSLLATGESVPGLAATVVDLREVRLNDAGSLVVAARIEASGGTGGAILRRAAGSWTVAVTDGPQPWLAAGESLVLPPDGNGCQIDAGSHAWVLAAISDGSATSRCLLKISPSGTVQVICREGAPLELSGESVTVTSLGPAEDWSCGPAGMACGRLTVVPTSGPARDVLVRWNGGHALPILESGRVFHGAAGDFTVASFRLDGGGTAEDGKGGFVISTGEWVATATASSGGDRLVHGASVADLDGDGRDDLLEAALGGDPSSPDGTALLGVQPVPAGAVLRYLRKSGAAFLYEVESSDDLKNWQPSTAGSVPAADQSGVPAGFQRMEAALAGTTGFARIRVSAD